MKHKSHVPLSLSMARFVDQSYSCERKMSKLSKLVRSGNTISNDILRFLLLTFVNVCVFGWSNGFSPLQTESHSPHSQLERNLKLCHLQTVALKLITITCHLDTGIDDFYLVYTKWLHVCFFLCLHN